MQNGVPKGCGGDQVPGGATRAAGNLESAFPQERADAAYPKGAPQAKAGESGPLACWKRGTEEELEPPRTVSISSVDDASDPAPLAMLAPEGAEGAECPEGVKSRALRELPTEGLGEANHGPPFVEGVSCLVWERLSPAKPCESAPPEYWRWCCWCAKAW